MTAVGLRIDVDTYRGTRLGVPALRRVLAHHGVTATFFFSVGPDNMGRHLWRLLRPAFLLKMLRTRAASLYGWDILVRGTLWPGPMIGARLAPVIRECAAQGHEIGLHAWDHHRWQARVERMDADAVRTEMRSGISLLEALGAPPTCSAAPGWRCTDTALEVKAESGCFAYNSDCRGSGVFLPVAGDGPIAQPQVPVNLPTYDEAVGRDGVTDADFNEHVLGLLQHDGYNVMCIHAEVEGLVTRDAFDDLLARSRARGFDLVPLSHLIPTAGPLPHARVERRVLPGREGWVSCRAEG